MSLAVAWSWAILRVWAWAVVLQATEGEDMVLWRRVLVESSWLKKNVVQNTRNVSSLVLCSTLCMMSEECQAWCRVQPHECVLLSLIVSGSYRPSLPRDATTCYTNRRPDFAVGSSITSSKSHGPPRVKENLVDGIYGGNMVEAAVADAGNDTAWFLVDLGVPRLISEVLLMTQPEGPAYHRFRDIEVQVGDEEVEGNFTTFTLLGTFVGPATNNQVVVLRPTVPLKGRYVSIEKVLHGMLQIAHLEIR